MTSKVKKAPSLLQVRLTCNFATSSSSSAADRRSNSFVWICTSIVDGIQPERQELEALKLHWNQSPFEMTGCNGSTRWIVVCGLSIQTFSLIEVAYFKISNSKFLNFIRERKSKQTETFNSCQVKIKVLKKNKNIEISKTQSCQYWKWIQIFLNSSLKNDPA